MLHIQSSEMHISSTGVATTLLPNGLAGYGPWYCMLLFNTSKTSKKQTHLVAHSNPALLPMVMNRGMYKSAGLVVTSPDEESDGTRTTRNASGGAGWVVMQEIGPFTSWTNCVRFLTLWAEKTRGKSRRLERGVDLFSTYAKRGEENLMMWGQTNTKSAIITNHLQRMQRGRGGGGGADRKRESRDGGGGEDNAQGDEGGSAKQRKRRKHHSHVHPKKVTANSEALYFDALNTLDGVFTTDVKAAAAPPQPMIVISDDVLSPPSPSHGAAGIYGRRGEGANKKWICVQTIKEIGGGGGKQ